LICYRRTLSVQQPNTLFESTNQRPHVIYHFFEVTPR
jgi:hypothetical protein